jgi:hypothetical protein
MNTSSRNGSTSTGSKTTKSGWSALARNSGRPRIRSIRHEFVERICCEELRHPLTSGVSLPKSMAEGKFWKSSKPAPLSYRCRGLHPELALEIDLTGGEAAFLEQLDGRLR